MNDQQPDEEAIFHIARDLADTEKRAAYLEQVCAGDQARRLRVEALLQTHEKENSFLQSNNDVAETADHSPISETEGQQIGRYKLLQKIGEGGFGVVFMAEQKQPVRRRVALKIIKPGMDSKSVVARFEAERQALAMMDHPNIARVLDGGQTRLGRPYFVMDLVKGTPITNFCDHNGLSTRERLKLFKSVCQAVQHAHQKGIIHRDLKPSNILVTLNDGQPMAKVIDFGVAKALNAELTEKTYFTEFGQMIGTLQYMSPEQAEMTAIDVDTRSDIYSLGVVLYELLTGSTPISGERLRASGYAEIQKIIREEEPLKPSSRLSTMGENLTDVANRRQTDPAHLRKGLQGEIDWIVMKALDKQRGRRYETANGLAMDVDRYLNDEPVEARPPSQWYLISKFARRNRGAVFAATSFAVFLLLATVAAVVAAVIFDSLRDDASDLAEQRRRDLYISDMRAIRLAWDEANIDLVQTLLDRNYPANDESDLRGFEWYYYWQLCDPARKSTVIKVRDGTDISRSASFSPDGKRLAVAITGGALLSFDPSDPTAPLSETMIPAQWGSFAVYGPDGSLVTSFGTDNNDQFGDGPDDSLVTPFRTDNNDKFGVSIRKDGQEQKLTGHTKPVKAAVFSRDGALLATSSIEEIIIWKRSTDGFDKSRRIPIESSRRAFDFSPNAKQILIANQDGLHAYDTETETEELFHLPLPDHVEAQISALTFSPDGKTVFAGSVDGFLIAWDVVQRKFITTIREHGDAIRFLSASPTENRIASASRDNTLKIWDAATLEVLHTLKGHSGIVDCVNFSPDGQLLVSASQDYTVRIWKLNQLKPSPLTPMKTTVRDVIVNDGLLLANPTLEDIREFRMADGMLQEVEGYIGQPAQAIALSPDGIIAVAGEQRVTLIRSGDVISNTSFVGEINPRRKSLQFSPDAKILALALKNGSVVRWDVSPKTKLLRERTLRAHASDVTALAFSPTTQDLMVTGSTDGKIRMWDLASGKLHKTQFAQTNEKRGRVMKFLFHPNGNWMASGGFDNRLRIWSTEDGSLIKTLTGHTASIWDLSLSPDGKQLFSAGGDRTIRIWDTADWQERGVLRGHHMREVLCFDWWDDHTLISGGAGDGLRLWRRSSKEDVERDRANSNR